MVACYTEDQKIRKVLRDLRIRRKLTLKEVGKELNVTKGYISQIELGKVAIPKFRVLIALLEVYEVKPKYFEFLLGQGYAKQ